HLAKIHQSLDAVIYLSSIELNKNLSKLLSKILSKGTSKAKWEKLEEFIKEAMQNLIEPKEGWNEWMESFNNHYAKAEFPICDEELRTYATELKNFLNSAQSGFQNLGKTDDSELKNAIDLLSRI